MSKTPFAVFGIGLIRRFSRSIAPPSRLAAFLATAALAFATPTSAEDRLSPLEKQERFDFEQCANQCQVTLDQRMYSCMPFRKDKRTKQPEDCAEVAYEIYNECVSYCPVDPRLRRRLSN